MQALPCPMPTKITKEFKWEMAHRLPDHPGECRNIHGHSYRMVVEIIGEAGPDGMVMDFGAIRDAVAPIVAKMDHAFLLDTSDSLMANFLKEAGLKSLALDCPTTTENLAEWLCASIAPMLAAPNIHQITIRVHETATATAEAAWKPA